VSADSLGPPRVVVIGAGFAGMAVVRALRDSDAHVYPFAMSQRKNAKTCLARFGHQVMARIRGARARA
jgi:NADH dehydrogenase FAD-containing subunit